MANLIIDNPIIEHWLKVKFENDIKKLEKYIEDMAIGWYIDNYYEEYGNKLRDKDILMKFLNIDETTAKEIEHKIYLYMRANHIIIADEEYIKEELENAKSIINDIKSKI